MKDKPDNYILYNRYLDRGAVPRIGTDEFSTSTPTQSRVSQKRAQYNENDEKKMKDTRSRAAKLLVKRASRKEVENIQERILRKSVSADELAVARRAAHWGTSALGRGRFKLGRPDLLELSQE